jgi:hypothetical protein
MRKKVQRHEDKPEERKEKEKQGHRAKIKSRR